MKRSMQNVKFSSVEACLDFLPPEERAIVDRLRALILRTVPDCTERLSYNVPYYRRHYNLCFIWPPSITWGGKSQVGVRLGFTSGNLLIDEKGYLATENRKQVYCRDYTSLEEIDVPIIQSFLFQAVDIDEARVQSKKSR